MDDQKHMKEMEADRIKQEKKEAEEKARLAAVKSEFKDVAEQWSKDKQALQDAENEALRDSAQKIKDKKKSNPDAKKA